MRLGLLLLFLIATIFGSSYWYSTFHATCRVPLRYHIGVVDERFGTSKEELKRIAQSAESIWEGPIGKDLFVYDENSSLPINFVFDERQERADLEAELREDLEAKEGMSASVSEQYTNLIGEFRSLKKKYESLVVAYERELSAYNEEVTKWNENGGAPEDVISQLKTTQNELLEEQTRLEKDTKQLNKIVAELNAIGARGNSLITDYNTIVNEYNERFSEAEEFTQGDYKGDMIDIYQFNAEDELVIVLAHEFGHALSLDHVTNEQSVMYHRMGKQSRKRGISAEDVAEFERVCDEQRGIVKTFYAVRALF